MRRFLFLVVPLVACGGSASDGTVNGPDPTKVPTDAPPEWKPIDESTLPTTCGGRLEAGPPPARPSSLRKSSCDFGETLDTTKFDLNCAPGTTCTGAQTGDQLCHRICNDDGKCADGEVCEERTLYVSDTPSRGAKLCMCASGTCAEKPPAPSTPEGGIDAWRVEPSMPKDLFYHASAASDRHLFVSGGLNAVERKPDGSGSSQKMSAISVADLDANGVVSGWREAGQLPRPMVQHAMAIVGDRLYVSGGDTEDYKTFSDEVFSYPIAADGKLGERRDETKLPKPRGWHVMLVDPAKPRLLIVSGSHSASFFTDGTAEISFADVDSATGATKAWETVSFPAPLYHDRAAGIAAGNLYGFASGEYNDRSKRALYGIPLSGIATAATPKVIENEAWPFDPSALSAVNERVGLAGTCDALVLVGEGGAVATAAVDGIGHTGVFRAAARFEGNWSNYSVTASPSGRVYVTGGFAGTIEQGRIVRSTRRL